jgi:hypothetical protein
VDRLDEPVVREEVRGELVTTGNAVDEQVWFPATAELGAPVDYGTKHGKCTVVQTIMWDRRGAGGHRWYFLAGSGLSCARLITWHRHSLDAMSTHSVSSVFSNDPLAFCAFFTRSVPP